MQAQPFQKTHAGTVEKARHQPRRSIQLVQQRRHLSRRHHHRQALDDFGFHDLFQPGQIDFKHLFIQKQQRSLYNASHSG
ncbi:hypothetical protein [Nitrosomonas sp. ANs5]|uniref:hypothetical protein n=1 Tax=Nitrosomonas sp. ANs5 TaxID=3423941 RepID=UPI003D3586C8